MKKTWIDRQQDFLMGLLRPLVAIWMRIDAKRVVKKDSFFDFRRKEPYVMLANHTFMFDVIHVPLCLRTVPFIIASQTLFTKQPAKFFVTQVAHVIAKSKGKSDIITIKNIYTAVKKGYSILIFPEGNTTFYGDTGYIEEATMKLIKKLGIDVITCNVKGGYLSKPRWATGKRKRRQIELNYQLTIPKEQLATLSTEEVAQTIRSALYHNDYDYQRQVMIPHPGKQLAEGLEDVVYVCPHCKSINSIRTNNNQIHCIVCQKEGYVDQYGFIQGFIYDNLIEWNEFQRNYRDALRRSQLSSTGILSFMSMEDESQNIIGPIELKYQEYKLYLSGSHTEEIPINEIINVTITLRRDLGFIYQDKHYIIKLDHYSAAFLRTLQDKY
jgi:1-acyl-sn-glycerol-3-phosphate acyltransferase